MPTPKGNEIAQKARTAALDKARKFSGDIPSGKVSFTPGKMDYIKSPEELEQGFIAGEMENTAVGDETGLPPGKYNVYVMREGDTWKAFAESNGNVVAEAKRVTVEEHSLSDRVSPKGRVSSEGWCFHYCWFSAWGICLIGTSICW